MHTEIRTVRQYKCPRSLKTSCSEKKNKCISLCFDRGLMQNFNSLLLFIAVVKWLAEDWKMINTCGRRWIIHICMLGTGAAAAAKQRRHLGQIREHPYQRAGALSWIRRAQSQYCTRLREEVSSPQTLNFFILLQYSLTIYYIISIYISFHT